MHSAAKIKTSAYNYMLMISQICDRGKRGKSKKDKAERQAAYHDGALGEMARVNAAAANVPARRGKLSRMYAGKGAGWRERKLERQDGTLRRVWEKDGCRSARRGGVDHRFDLMDRGDGEAALARMLADQRLAGRLVNTENLVAGDVAVHPLDVWPEFVQHIAGGPGNGLQFVGSQLPCSRQIAFDDILWHNDGGVCSAGANNECPCLNDAVLPAKVGNGK